MKWTDQANQELAAIYHGSSFKALAAHFGTTEYAIMKHSKSIGLLRKKRVKPVVIKEKVRTSTSFKRPPAIYNNVNWYEETLKKYA